MEAIRCGGINGADFPQRKINSVSADKLAVANLHQVAVANFVADLRFIADFDFHAEVNREDLQ